MAEIALTGGMIGLGYLLNQSRNNDNRQTLPTPQFQQRTHLQHPYETSIIAEAKLEESQRASRMFADAKQGASTGVIAHEFNHNIINSSNNIPQSQAPSQPTTYISELTGQPMTREEFTHNNMVPFFGGSLKQNMSFDAHQHTLEKHTGIDKNWKPKCEVEPFFSPEKDRGYVNGAPNQLDRIKQYINPSLKRNNEFPIEQIRVGPGLNKGFTADPSGGFHQADTRDYVMPKSVDELRTLNNPKLTYRGRVIKGKSKVDKRGFQATVDKNRPYSYYEQGPERYLVTTGAYIKDRKRPTVVLKDTNRKTSSSIVGSAGPATIHAEAVRPEIKVSTKVQLKDYGVRNAGANDKWSNIDLADYGKTSIRNVNTERAVTGVRTHTTNLTQAVKALISPLLDVMRTTRKENFVGNPRQSGNVGKSGPSAHTVYDPNDIARTTIKETTLSAVELSNLRGEKRAVVYDPNDIARTTIRETTENNGNQTGYLHRTAANAPTVYDPDDIAKTTIRETTENNNNQTGFVSRGVLQNGEGYNTNEMEAPSTHREFTSTDYTGTANAASKEPMSYDAIYNATINELKELTLVGREPTPSNVKLANGGDTVNIDIKKLDSDRNSKHVIMPNKVYQDGPTKAECEITREKNQLENDSIADRINPKILDAFKQNPYTKPLNSTY